MAHSRSFLANQKARNAIVGPENLLSYNIVLSLKIAGRDCIRKWRYRSKRAIVSCAGVNNNGDQD